MPESSSAERVALAVATSSQPHDGGDDAMMEMVAAAVAAPEGKGEEITITEQDVLFGRGGLTNRHIGNLRFRDIISIHRQDYVSAVKTEKPNVAKKIVQAIKSGDKSGRFLRKGDDDKWHVVNDKEAAWKVSQALREKSRWSTMKKEGEGDEVDDGEEQVEDTKQPAAPVLPAQPPLPIAMAVDIPAAQKVVEPSMSVVTGDDEKAKSTTHKKRKNANEDVGALKDDTTTTKRVKTEELANNDKKQASSHSSKNEQQQRQVNKKVLPALTMPTEISHITMPTLENSIGMPIVRASAASGSTSVSVPNEEDVLFGRGGRTNHNPGNKRLRDIVINYRNVYCEAKKIDKPKISRLIVSALRFANPPSRFLRCNDDTNQWEDVGDKRAAEKVSQTLREKEKTEKAAPSNYVSANMVNHASPKVEIPSTLKEDHSSGPGTTVRI